MLFPTDEVKRRTGPTGFRQNRPIFEKRTSSTVDHDPKRPGRRASRRAGHWWEILTRTLPGRLVLLLTGVALIGLVTAAIGYFVLGAFTSFGEALWSAIAHLVDPGSIGDDNTAAERVTGLVQVIAGIIFFAGIVLTVLTEVVDRALRRLEKGDPAVRRAGHLLIVGFNPSLGEVQERLRLAAEQDEPPEIVVMLPLDEASRRDETRRQLSGYPARTTVVVAEPGDDGFERVCAAEARAVVLLSPTGEPDAADLEVTDRAAMLDQYLSRAGDAQPSVAVEFRRARNVRAFWLDGPAGSKSRFPDNFDALVNDRNIGAILLLAVLNAAFAELLLDDGEVTFAPGLIPAGTWAGRSYGEARAGLDQHHVLGILNGSGPQAKATYLPDKGRILQPDDRLITVPTEEPADPSPAPVPDSLKAVPTRPGPVLMLGWSDASEALASELEQVAPDSEILHLLDLELPAAGRRSGLPLRLIEGSPSEPTDIAAAIRSVEPEIIWVAVRDGSEPGAVISGLLARQVTDVPILVEQTYDDRSRQSDRVTQDLTVISTGGILAESVALSLGDPAVLVAREGMLDDPSVALESLTYTGSEALPVARLRQAFLKSGAVPLAISLDSDDETQLRTGDQILAFHRRSRF